MGKARALRLGITKGVAKVGMAVLPTTYKCPLCKYQFNAYDVALEAKNTGVSAEEIIGEHILQCIKAFMPERLNSCPDCGEKIKGKDFADHMHSRHPVTRSHTDSSESNSGNTEKPLSGDKSSATSTALATERESEKHVDTEMA